MPLTSAQIHEIREIIRDHHTAFVASVISPDAVAPEILERLKEKGIVDVTIASIEDAYLYGQVLAALDTTKGMGYEQFKEHVRKHPVPLTDIEKRAIDMAQHSAGQYAVGLGNRIEQETGNIIFEADAGLRARMREEIKDRTAENIARRESVKKLKSDLGWATKDWARDWDRVAVTEKHRAMQRGQADHIAKRYGEDASVFVRPNPGACKNCLRLYQGPDDNPRIFKLSTLEANGTNFGKKAADWLPVIPPAHPNCQGNLSRVPAGWGFDEQGRLSPKGEGGVEYESGADLELALMQEDDLQKAFKLQGHAEFQGLPIVIENKAGSVRKWTTPEGEGGETRMKYAYGYVERTMGDDGDEIDVFLGPDPRAKMAYVIHQQDPKTGRWDESKVMLGFSNQKLAESAYQDHYDSPEFFITTSPMSVDHFKRWIKGTQPSEFFKAGEPTQRFVIPAERLEKAGPYIGPRGGKWADLKHTIPWRESIGRTGPRTGAIQISEAHVAFMVEEMLEATKANRQGIIPGKPQTGHSKFDLRDPSGRTIPITAFVTPRPQKDPRGITGNARTSVIRENAKAKIYGVAIHLYPDDHTGQYRPDLAKKMRDVLSHELTHALDPTVTSRLMGVSQSKAYARHAREEAKKEKQTYVEYLNEKTEVTASIQQIVRDLTDKPVVTALLESAKLYKEDQDFPPPEHPQELLDYYSPRWEQVGEHYTPENRKRVLKAVSHLRNAILAGQVKGIRKSLAGVDLVIPGERLEKAGPFIGPRGGKWQDPQHKTPWKEKKTKGVHPVLDLSAGKQKAPVHAPAGPHQYGLTFRPPGIGALPKGEFTHGAHPDFRHGVVTFKRPLNDEEVKSYQLTPLLSAKDIATRVDKAVAEILSEYPKEQRELAEEDPRNFSLGARLALTDQGPGHLPDIDQLVETIRQKVLTGGGKKSPDPVVGAKIGVVINGNIYSQGKKDYPIDYHVVAVKGDKVQLSPHGTEGTFGPWMPKASVSHFVNDLAGKVDVPPNSGNAAIDAVSSGKAKFLGKGDDGMAFKVGDQVVKVSTTVPYQPDNPGHRSPEEAVKMLRGQAELGNKLADLGIRGIQRSEFVTHGDKGFQIKPWVEIPEKFTRAQLDAIQDIVIKVHEAGYSINNNVQAGLDKKGNPVLFDVGKAGKIQTTSGVYSDVETDMDNLRSLYQEHGEPFVRQDVDEAEQLWQRVTAEMIPRALKAGRFGQAEKWLERAADKKRDQLKATLKGEDLKEELEILEDFTVADVQFDIDRARKKAGKLSKGRVANVVGAAQSPAAGRAPGQSSAANFAFHVPVKPRPPTVLPEDLMGIGELDGRKERIKLDKETFEVRAPFHREPQMMIIPMGDGLDPEEVERHRKQLEEMHRGNIGPKIQVPVAEEAKP